MSDQDVSAEHAQGKLNRAVSRWAANRTQIEGTRVEMDLYAALQQYRDATSRAFMAASRESEQTPPEYLIPEAPIARELRIANLLTAAMYPTPLGVDGSDVARKDAMQQALGMLGLLPAQ